VVVDLVVLVGWVAGVELVVVVVDLVASGPGVELVVVVVDLIASEPGIELVVLVDLVTSSAALSANSIIVAISIATNILFMLKPLFSSNLCHSRQSPLSIFHNAPRGK
jgi:hypothetical protein